MRWLIVGSYPPERGRGAAVAAEFVAERLDAGDDVHVVSPRPSAAHTHRDLVGRSSLRWLARMAAEHDGVWIRIEAGIAFTREPSRWEALYERFLLGRVLRSADKAVLDVGDVSMLPGGRAGAFVFGPTTEIVAHSAVDRDALVASGAERVRVGTTPTTSATPANPEVSVPRLASPQDLSPMTPLARDASRTKIEAAVRARARDAPFSRAD